MKQKVSRLKRPTNPSFRHFQEVQALKKYAPRNRFTPEDCVGVVYDYVGNGMEFECDLIDHRTGARCRRPHDWGYVVELKDGTFALVGNRCIHERLDPDHHLLEGLTQFRIDRDFNDKFDQIKAESSEFDDRSKLLNSILRKLEESEKTLSMYHEHLGAELARDIHTRARTGTKNIVINVVYNRQHTESDGSVVKERSEIPHTIGRINGIGFLLPSKVRALRNEIEKIANIYAQFDESKVNQANVNVVQTRLNNAGNLFKNVVTEATEFFKDEEQFADNNFSHFAYINDRYVNRIKACRYHLRVTGLPSSKDEGKRLVHQLDKSLLEITKADSWRI